MLQTIQIFEMLAIVGYNKYVTDGFHFKSTKHIFDCLLAWLGYYAFRPAPMAHSVRLWLETRSTSTLCRPTWHFNIDLIDDINVIAWSDFTRM